MDNKKPTDLLARNPLRVDYNPHRMRVAGCPGLQPTSEDHSVAAEDAGEIENAATVEMVEAETVSINASGFGR